MLAGPAAPTPISPSDRLAVCLSDAASCTALSDLHLSGPSGDINGTRALRPHGAMAEQSTW